MGEVGSRIQVFDSTDTFQVLNDRIESFLRQAAARPQGQRIYDVVVCFVGHGFFDAEDHYYLATSSFKPGAPEYSYRFNLLQRTVKAGTPQARKYFVLDACFSAAAAGEMMAQSPQHDARLIVREVKDFSAEDLPERGTALLCAASKDDQAMMPRESPYTMFTGAMLDVLGQGDEVVQAFSLRQLHALIRARIDEKWGTDGVHPEIHSPEQKDGDVGAIPLFTVRHLAGTAYSSNALDPTTFGDRRMLHAVVVCRSAAGSEIPVLIQHLGDAWHNYHRDIGGAVRKCRATWRAEPLPAGLDEDAIVISHLRTDQAFESEVSLGHAVLAMCRADITLFDLSDWDPVAIFLLGVRSVVRRGVSIASVASVRGTQFRLGSGFEVPFNLQLLNLASHSEMQEKEGAGKRPFELLGLKIMNGFAELDGLPHYLDLPAYDAVRQLGPQSDAYRIVPMRERLLVLCPFNDKYEQTNWARLERMLPGCVQNHVERVEGRPLVKAPELARLLDLRTPRLVSQTLYESIRLVELCVIDWTDRRPNVVFEAGVRLAAHSLGAVHIVDEAFFARMRRDDPADAQVLAILDLLRPIRYPLKGNARTAFDGMVQSYVASVEASERGSYQVVYAAAGAAMDRQLQPAAQPLVGELRRQAGILDPEDSESEGVTAVLYKEVNQDLGKDAKEAAADRRLAAWLFLTRRYSAEEIAADSTLLAHFDFLNVRVRIWARRARLSELRDETGDLERRIAALRSNDPTVAP